MKGRVEREVWTVRELVTAAGIALTQLWGCSPIDLISDPGTTTDGRDAAITSAGEPSSELSPTSRELPTTTGPKPEPESTEHWSKSETTNVAHSDSTTGVAEENSRSSASTNWQGEARSSVAEPDPTSEEPEPPVDPECLAQNIDSMPPGLAGFASVEGYDVAETVGGLGGLVVYVGSEQSLRTQLQSSEPRVVVVCGEIGLTSRLEIGSNKTLVGLGPSSILRGGIGIRGEDGNYVSNVIVANLVVDASTVQLREATDSLTGVQVEFAHHVWLDHLEVYNAPLGLVDVVAGSDLVTMSWNKFYFTQEAPDLERRFGVRIGDVTDDTVLARDGGKLRVTLHHNWFGEFIRQRMPRVAYGQAHIINNYYSTTGNDTAIWGLSQYARVLVESNYFERTHRPHDVPPSTEVPNDELAQIVALGNVYYGTTGARKTQGTVFDPPYTLVRDSVVWLPSLVPWGAGPHASFEPKPPWSDAGVIAPEDVTSTPDAGTGGGLTSDATFSGPLSNAPDASQGGSGVYGDASVDGGSTASETL